MRPKGLVTISKITLADGTELPTWKAVEYGWIAKPEGRQPTGWGLERHEIPLGENLFVDQGRQLVAYAFGFRSPVQNYVCANFGVGTGTTAAKVTDVSLEAPITLSNGQTVKAVDTIDFLSPFTVRVGFTLSVNDANGYIISEQGLFSGSNALFCRKIRSVSINKTSDFASTLTWRIRF
jgi:hypothetical protein